VSELSDDVRAEPPVIARRPLLLLFGAGVGGGAWSALMQIVATPFYLRLLGIEVYGLIGFYTAMQGLLQVLDMGAGIMVSREMARLTAANRFEELRDFVRTLEVLYWLAAILIGGALVAAAPALARTWFRDAHLDPAQLQRALMMMALLWAIQWLTTFYQAALIGLERFGPLNLLKIIAATTMHAGGVLWLSTISATPFALFAFQAAVAALHLLAGGFALAAHLPRSPHRAKVRPAMIASRWRFAGAVAGITIAGTLLAQSDKIIVSGVLPLREFGFYALAALVANSLFIAVVPLFHVILPRLSALSAVGDESGLRDLYRSATQAITVLAVAPACVVAFLGNDLISVWTGEPDVARKTATVAAVLVVGSALNALMTPPYALQLAIGTTRFAFLMATAQLLCFIPLVTILANRYGAIGAAAVWPLIHTAYVAIGVPYTYRRLLTTDVTLWLRDTLPPTLAAILVAAVLSLIPTAGTSVPVRLLYLVGTATAVLLAAILAAPRVRMATVSFARRLVQA